MVAGSTRSVAAVSPTVRNNRGALEKVDMRETSIAEAR
jgi:hypothetical protein